MIRELSLRDWRNYENVVLRFDAGVTFIVASNGIGKTSLIEGARWALFGERGATSAVRAGAESAVATVHVELPDQRVLIVERAMSSKPRGRVAGPTVLVDGELREPAELDALLAEAFGADATFLARLTLPRSGDDFAPGAMRLEDHLGHYYGVDSLRQAAERLRETLKSNQANIKQIKLENAVSAKVLDKLVDDAALAGDEAAELAAAHSVLVSRQKIQQDWEKFDTDRQEWVRATGRVREARSRLAASSIAENLDATSENIGSVLGLRRTELDREIEDVRVKIALNAARERDLIAHQRTLADSHGGCPVCRRPIDTETVIAADEIYRRDVAGLAESTVGLEATLESLTLQRKAVTAALAEWGAISDPGPAPDSPPNTEDEANSTQLDAMVTDAMNGLIEARTTQRQAERKRDDAIAADAAMRQLEQLFRREAATRVAINTVEATLSDLLDETIRPLASEVNLRWQEFFPDRGPLMTRSDGSITRMVNGHALSYDSFSDGEGMSVAILLRLLVAQMATKIDFGWFDEPLEHLDPDTRRKMANLLSKVPGSGGPLKQIVVTTYESSLARLLHERDPENVRIIDVRHTVGGEAD